MKRLSSDFGRFLLAALLLVGCFARPLVSLVCFGFREDLFSYILLIPFISGYFVWLRRREITQASPGARWPATFAALIGLGSLGAAWRMIANGANGASAEVLSLQILSFCCLIWGIGILFLGWTKVCILAFPALFLLFMVPISPAIVDKIEVILQRLSADAAFAFIKLSGIPVYRSGLDLHIPRIVLSVGPECSGIRSTLILFITSLIAGSLFLRSLWLRWTFALLVIPLGIARNAFRILVLSVLCSRFDPAYIDSPIHHKGGPVFFILSLIPFGMVLLLMRRVEKRRHC
jgi:exosortase C (VPDSG-CTERM-specific)